MSVVVNEVRRGTYLDSIALMRMTRAVTGIPGVEEAGLMMGTPANVRIMRDAGVLAAEGEKAAPGDLVIAIRARDRATADAALAEARRQLDAPRHSAGAAAAWAPRSIRAAMSAAPDANLALISVPGTFAAAEARKALGRGLNVLMFSDNVPVAEEVALKREARERGLLVMGPDCGTAIINGVPLGFANAVPRGDIGIVGASGTGIQEVCCLIANNGGGISHAIGTGGRDLKSEVGGITTLMALDLLDADPGTRHIVVISKPPAKDVAEKVLERVGKSKKPFTVCFVGWLGTSSPPSRGEGLGVGGQTASASIDPHPRPLPASRGTRASGATGRREVQIVSTLKAAAEHALGRAIASSRPRLSAGNAAKGKLIRGLFAGGTLCAEAQVVLRDAGLTLSSNAAIPGVTAADKAAGEHVLIDLGDDAYTQGRPHPMIEPAVRDAPLAAALADPQTGVILLDIVLGYGASADPAGHLARRLVGRAAPGPLVVASITGTELDGQGLRAQLAELERAGVAVATSAADAAALALTLIQGKATGG